MSPKSCVLSVSLSLSHTRTHIVLRTNSCSARKCHRFPTVPPSPLLIENHHLPLLSRSLSTFPQHAHSYHAHTQRPASRFLICNAQSLFEDTEHLCSCVPQFAGSVVHCFFFPSLPPMIMNPHRTLLLLNTEKHKNGGTFLLDRIIRRQRLERCGSIVAMPSNGKVTGGDHKHSGKDCDKTGEKNDPRL